MREQASENPEDRWTAAMARGDFEDAWRESDRVLQERDSRERDDPRLPYHLRWVWDGSPVEGRSALVRCYHGLGDTLQFCRYLAALRRRARRVTLEVQAELAPLLATMPGIDRIVPFDPASPLPLDECDLEIMELAHALRLRPDPAPYLLQGPSRAGGRGLGEGGSRPTELRLPTPPLAPALPRQRRNERDGFPRIGLCWRVGQGWQPERSVPDELAAGLAALPGIEWVSLQPGGALPGLAADCPAEILATARLIVELDAVVAVDTMVAHLAGAIGVPLRLLLPHAPDWRWLAGGDGSVWYRDVRKYRQPRPGDWGPALAALAADLTEAADRGTLLSGVGSL